MSKKNKILITMLSVLCTLSIIFMIFALQSGKNETAKFIPPKFDENVCVGAFEAPAEIRWSELYRDGMSFKVGICSKLIVKNNKADIYFSSSEDNNVWLKIRILNSKNDDIIYESGLIKPGEYIKSVQLSESLSTGDKVKLKIMSYQMGTYYSEGSIVLNTLVQSGD